MGPKANGNSWAADDGIIKFIDWLGNACHNIMEGGGADRKTSSIVQFLTAFLQYSNAYAPTPLEGKKLIRGHSQRTSFKKLNF